MNSGTTTAPMNWSAQLLDEIAPVCSAVVAHPFMRGVADGTLSPEIFRAYLLQDVHYLRDYARALAIVGAKAPTAATMEVLARHAALTAAVEYSALVENDASEAALDTVEVGPTTRAYIDHVLARAYDDFSDGLAAVLPCYLVFAHFGRELAGHGSPNPRYHRWLDTYASAEFTRSVTEILDVADRTGPYLDDVQRMRAVTHLRTSARYEWMLWDSVFRGQRWPL